MKVKLRKNNFYTYEKQRTKMYPKFLEINKQKPVQFLKWPKDLKTVWSFAIQRDSGGGCVLCAGESALSSD